LQSLRLSLVVAASAWLLAPSGVSGQNMPSPGPFDGKWIGESARCSPASSTYRFTGLTVTKGSFTWTAKDSGRQASCRVTVDRDGSFASNMDCAFQLSGKMEGKMATIRIKTSERDCDIVARHE
jgi:hypothetical protein